MKRTFVLLATALIASLCSPAQAAVDPPATAGVSAGPDLACLLDAGLKPHEVLMSRLTVVGHPLFSCDGTPTAMYFSGVLYYRADAQHSWYPVGAKVIDTVPKTGGSLTPYLLSCKVGQYKTYAYLKVWHGAVSAWAQMYSPSAYIDCKL